MDHKQEHRTLPLARVMGVGIQQHHMGVRVREEEVVNVVRRRESGWQYQLLLSLKVNMINGQC